MRNYQEEYARREARAQEAGFSSYREQRESAGGQLVNKVTSEPAPASEVDPEVVKLKGELRSTLLKLESLRRSKDDVIEAVRDSVSTALSALYIPPVRAPHLAGGSRTPETAIAVLSDWQLGKLTPSYDSATCEARIEEYADTIERLVEMQRHDHPVPDLRVYLLGDIVEGELIFPGQAHRIDASLFRQVMVDGPRILVGFLRRMLTIFERVHVVGVIGNHGSLGGRSRQDMHPESNADTMLYELCRQLLAGEDRLTFDPNFLDGERKWCAVDAVGEKRFLLFHGDQARGGGGIAGLPYTGLTKAVLKWANGGIASDFDYALCGHHHTPTRITIGNKTLWLSGSTESDNTYASEWFNSMGTPSQWLLFAHPRRGVTAEYQVRLGRRV